MKTDTISAMIAALLMILPILLGIFVNNIWAKLVAVIFLIFLWVAIFSDLEKYANKKIERRKKK